jgi:hypothetical protein
VVVGAYVNHRGHYINWPFSPRGTGECTKRDPEPVTALAENASVLKNQADSELRVPPLLNQSQSQVKPDLMRIGNPQGHCNQERPLI